MKAGRIVRALRDSSRPELFDSEPARSVVVSIYYPPGPNAEEDRHAAYADLFAPATDRALGLLSGMGVDPDELKRLDSGVHNEAPVLRRPGGYPVMLYSPAFGVVNDMYTFNIVRLVQEGYIVVAVGAAYESIFTVFPDGTWIGQSERISALRHEDARTWELLRCQRTEDLLFVRNELERLNRTDDQVSGLFDLTRIGVIGHSLGGAAAVASLQSCPYIRTAILMDPSFHLIPARELAPISKPVLLMRQQHTSREELAGRMAADLIEPFVAGYERLAVALAGFRSIVSVPGTDHMSFCDVPLHYGDQTIRDKHEAINRTMLLFLSASAPPS